MTPTPPSSTWQTQVRIFLVNLAKTIRLVWRVHPGYTIAMVGLTLLQGVFPVVNLWVTKALIDTATEAVLINTESTAVFGKLFFLIAILAALVLGGLLLNTLTGVLQSLLGNLLQQQISLQILEKTNQLELAFFENAQFYDKLQNAYQEVGFRPLEITSQTLFLGQGLITLLSMIFLLVRLNGLLFPLILITLLPSVMVQNYYGYSNYWLLRQRAPEIRKQQYVGSLLTGEWVIKELRVFQLEKYLLDLFKSLFAKFYAENRALTLQQSWARFLASLASITGWFTAMTYVVLQLAQRLITIGDLTIYYQAIGQTQGVLQSLLASLSGLYTNALFIQNLFEFLEEPLPQYLTTGQIWDEPIREIEFQDVSFRYPGTENLVLQHINFTIRRGQVLALIGKNGSGKTTLIKLICRLYVPTSGKILLNGKDASLYTPQSLQEQVAVIFQDYGHYQLTVQENIGFGRLSQLANLTALEAAARQSGAHEIIQAFAKQYETVLGRHFEGGQELSYGQWQKIALARAYLRNGSVLILDEPTAALDAEAEHAVFEEISQQKANRMTILVSHRFSTTRMVDQILMVEKGQIIEWGSHAELIQHNGRYAQLYHLQSQAYQDTNEA